MGLAPAFLQLSYDSVMATLTAKHLSPSDSDQVFQMAADLFRIMSAPVRLQIISSLCHGEKNVSQLLQESSTSQANMSQHLNALYRAAILGRRRQGVQIFYFISNPRVVDLCRTVCTDIAMNIH